MTLTKKTVRHPSADKESMRKYFPGELPQRFIREISSWNIDKSLIFLRIGPPILPMLLEKSFYHWNVPTSCLTNGLTSSRDKPLILRKSSEPIIQPRLTPNNLKTSVTSFNSRFKSLNNQRPSNCMETGLLPSEKSSK